MLVTVRIFGHTIAMYGVMIVIGILVGTWIAMNLKPSMGIKKEDVLFSMCYGVIGCIIGAKFLYLLISIPELVQRYREIFSSIQTLTEYMSMGFVFFGGVFGGIIGVVIYTKQYGINRWNLLSRLIVVVPLIHSFGRMGCLCAGCCYGKPYNGIGKVIFTNTPYAPIGIPLFPTQIVEAISNLFLFALLLYMYRKEKSSRKIIGTYFVWYGIARCCIEFVRGDVARGIYGGISTSQYIGIVVVVCGIILIRRKNLEKQTNA